MKVTGGDAGLSRRRALALGGSAAGGLVAASSPFFTSPRARAAESGGGLPVQPGGRLPVGQIEKILQTPGMVMNGVLGITQERTDIHATVFDRYPVLPPWALANEFAFQPGPHRAALNAEITVLTEEITPVIDALVADGAEVMALHNHLVATSPPIWYIHFKGFGDPVKLAQVSVRAVRRTGTPLPQHPPAHPATPLDVAALHHILGGTVMVHDEGVVEADIPRRETIVVEGVVFKPEMHVQVELYFEPLGGHQAALHAELATIASEEPVVIKTLRAQGLVVTASHHHETGERPQLYFVHAFGADTDVSLARRIAKVLDRMNLKR